MRIRYAVVIASLALAGCPGPMPAPGQVRTATRLDCDGTGLCDVEIRNPRCSGSTCTADVEYDEVHFKRGKNNIRVKWKLPQGYGFCPNTGDGVWLKKPDPDHQFKDPGLDGPQGPGVCRRPNFVMTAENSVPERRFPYKVVFHDKDGVNEYVIDPAMFND